MKKKLLLIGAMSFFALSSFSQTTVELVKDLNPNGNGSPIHFKEHDGKMLFFGAKENGDRQLWRSDGTESGTEEFKVINPDGSSEGNNFTEMDGKLYFSAKEGLRYGLWTTDGTAAGTNPVTTATVRATNTHPRESFTELNGYIYFSALVAVNNSYHLWRTDGTPQGTGLFKIMNTNGSSDPRFFTELNEKLYFFADDGSGSQLWVTDGTESGTQLLKTINPNGESFPTEITKFNNKMYFGADNGVDGKHLWVSDGSTSGTEVLKAFNEFDSYGPMGFTEFNGKLYFSANNITSGQRYLWSTDGTEAGTALVKDVLVYGETQTRTWFEELNGRLYFGGGQNHNLWSTDGTTEGTEMVKEINHQTFSSQPEDFTRLGDKIFFTALTNIGNRELYVTDGTPEGTKVVTPYVSTNNDPCNQTRGFFHFENALYFSANFSSMGEELYKITDIPLSTNNESDLPSFKAFPNPTNDKLTITTAKNTSFSLLDLSGKVLNSFDVDQHKEISIAHLAAGIYLVRDNATGSQAKIVKQ